LYAQSHSKRSRSTADAIRLLQPEATCLPSEQVAELVHDLVTQNYATNDYEVADNLPEIDKAIKHKAFLMEGGDCQALMALLTCAGYLG
jgi:hypothetical protein